MRDLLGINRYSTLDDEDSLDDVSISAKNFLSKLGEPSIIDEAQKAPALFDAIKLQVDIKRKPGRYYLTGSSQFSSKLGIRESLTGRIGLNYIYPFTLAEAHELPLDEKRLNPLHKLKPRFGIAQAMHRLPLGGLPIPLFTRDPKMRNQYFQGWLETAILRDASRIYGGRYDPDIAQSIMRQIGQALREGELPTLAHFKQNSRVLRRYLDALEGIFLIRKIPCHEAGVGKEAWLVTDCGLARQIMGTEQGEGATLSLCRIFLLNEILASCEASGQRQRPLYFKSARGSPVDLVWKGSLLKVSVLPKSQISYDERALKGAMKKLQCKSAFIVATRDEIQLDSKRLINKINLVPLTYWS